MKTKLMTTLAILVVGFGISQQAQASATVMCGSAAVLKNSATTFNPIAHLFIAGTSDGQSCVIRYSNLQACPATIPATGVTTACRANPGFRAVGSQPYIGGKGTVVLPAAANAIMQNQTGYTSAQVISAFVNGIVPSSKATTARVAAAPASSASVTTIKSALEAMGPLQ